MKTKAKRSAKSDVQSNPKRLKVEPKPSEEPEVISLVEKFDQICRLTISDQLVNDWSKKNLKKKSSKEDVQSAFVSAVSQLLQKGLGSRITAIDCHVEAENEENLDNDNDDDKIMIGLSLNSQHYMSVLERGPSGDSNEANSFREFWGEKSELRKFSDGGICEAVVWEGQTIAEKRLILSKIVKFLLKRQESSVLFICNQLDRFIGVQIGDQTTTGEELNQQLLSQFEQLGKKLRNITGLPLSINNIQGVAESLRLTEVNISQPCSGSVPKDSVYVRGNSLVPRPGCLIVPPYRSSLDVQITLESSGSWPNDLTALRHCKTAFYLRLGERLKEDHKVVCVPHRDCLMVVHGGFVFSLVLVVPRELALLKETRTETGMIKVAETEESKQLDKHVVALPKFSSTIKGVALQESSFSCVCRLAKRWISSHMLSDYIQPEAIELLVAHLYISPAPLIPPQGHINGFIRFLTLLSSHDWLSSPLIVNFNEGLSREAMDEVRNDFIKKRPILPPMCISTPYDKSGTLWTRPHPNAALLERMIRLADVCKKTVLKMLSQPTADLNLGMIFRPPVSSFDCVINLLPSRVSKRSVSLWSKFKDEYKTEVIPNKIPVVEFDPAECYMKELRDCYDSVARFFYDRYGGTQIGVVWKPAAMEKSDFKVSKLVGRRPNAENPFQLQTDINAIVEHFKFIGRGIVESVEVLRVK